MQQEALIVLVGITAGHRDRDHVSRYFLQNSNYDVFVPALPYRRGLRDCARWFSRYLETTVIPTRYASLHAVAYIAAGPLLRYLPARPEPLFERMVYIRGPFQERVAGRLIKRIGRTLAGLLMGRSMIDMVDGLPASLPQLRQSRHEGLIIELGRSWLARLLGIRAADLPADAWTPAQLIPTAEAVLHIPESHDDVYTTDRVLAAALHFVRNGTFPAASQAD